MTFVADYLLDRFSGVLSAQLLSSQTSGTFQINLASALGTQLVTITAGYVAKVTIEDEQILLSNFAVSGSTVTCTIAGGGRGYSGSQAATHASDAAVEIHLTKSTIENIQTQLLQTVNTDIPAIQASVGQAGTALIPQSPVTTIASATSHTIATDLTSIFTVGRTFLFEVSSVWYRATITASSFGGGTTTITLVGDSLPGAGTVTACGFEQGVTTHSAELLSLIKQAGSNPAANPPSGYYWLFFKSTGLYYMDSTGTVRTVLTGSSNFGDGSDGALTITSGTTTLNTASKTVYQYSSVSITGTAQLALGSNLQNLPCFILVQGNLTITASGTSVLGKGLGGQAGTGGTAGSDDATNGTSGVTAPSANFGTAAAKHAAANHTGSGGGGGGGYGNAGTAGTTGVNGGTVGAGGASWSLYNINFPVVRQIANSFIGGGGGGGAGSSNAVTDGGAGGNGGKGGGCLFFYVGGDINLTTGTIDMSGNDGSNGVAGTSYGGGGGGGGAGGFCGIYYLGAATANTISFTVAGGTGGAAGGGSNAGGIGGTGGAGQKEVRQIKLSSIPV